LGSNERGSSLIGDREAVKRDDNCKKGFIVVTVPGATWR
jgi:hypothetical protein